MGFDFFKKKKQDKKGRRDDAFNPAEEGLEFDDFDSSGEFLSEGDGQAPPPYASPPPPAPYAAPPPPAQRPAAPPPPAPPPQQYQPPRPAPPPRSPAPRPAPPRAPAGDEHCDDLTLINAPPPVAAPQTPAAPATGRPVPPGPPVRPVPPVPAAAPPVAPPVAPPPQRAAPTPPADDETQILDAPVGRESLVAWLVLAGGPNRGRDHRLPGGTIRLGGDPGCDICIGEDQFASAQHAEISFRDGQYQIRDLGSTNGTFVNDERVAEAVLRDGDQVRLALTEFVYKSLLLG